MCKCQLPYEEQKGGVNYEEIKLMMKVLAETFTRYVLFFSS